MRVKGAIVAIAGIGAVLSGLAGYWTVYKIFFVQAPSAKTTAIPANAGPLSILVLPFANQTGDGQKAYVADAITAGITTDLGRIRAATVIPTSSAQGYRGKLVGVQQIGQDAGVRYVLEGTVLLAAETIRIHTQLSDTQSGAQIWSDSFDTPFTNLFELQDHVTGRIYNSIAREMVLAAGRAAQKKASSAQDTDLILRASALSLQPEAMETHEKIQALYRQVLAHDPDNVRAMVGLAVSLVLQANNFRTVLAGDAAEKKFEEGRSLALKAKEVDPENPDVYLVLASYAGNHGDVVGATHAAETRLSLDPKNPRALNFMAFGALWQGDGRKAADYLTKAIALDPKHPSEVVLSNLGFAYFLSDDNEAAIEWLTRSIERNPKMAYSYAFLSLVYQKKGDKEKSREYREQLLKINPGYKLTKTALYQKAVWDVKVIPLARLAGIPE